MGGCAAPFCNNSSSKGYIMKIFPRDPVRRALWTRNVPRENWAPTNNSFLCEVSNKKNIFVYYNKIIIIMLIKINLIIRTL